jgi:hypothetical protein
MVFGLRGDIAQMQKVVGYALPMFENDKILALPKNDGVWRFYVNGKLYLFHNGDEKVTYLRMLNAILLVLSGDMTEANKQVAKIESSPLGLPASVKGMLAAEVAVLRGQHPDLVSRLNPYQVFWGPTTSANMANSPASPSK